LSRVPAERAPAREEPGPRGRRTHAASCTLYIGVTNDLVRRIGEARLVPGFTRKYGVDKLVYFEQYASILEARARERSLKRWQRAWKLALIEKMNPQWRDLTNELTF